MAPLTVNHSAPAQQVAKLPVYSNQYGAMDGNKTVQTVVSFNTGKRYKRETNLKFSEGTVDQYESFRSKFNIHNKMLAWDNNRVGIELYMSLEGKAALKVEDELICLFGKARPGRPLSFQNEEVNNQLLSGLPFEVMEIVVGYLDIMAAEIARKFDVNASQREALGLQAQGPIDKPLLSVQEKQSGSDDPIDNREFEHLFAF